MTRLRAWIGPMIVALVAVMMCAWSWGKWPDPVIDFGREAFVPWQLSKGKVLYRNIVSYFNGPLAPYLHALVFEIFGVSLRVLVIFNLIVIALLAALLYRLIARVSDALTATTSLVVFFVLFAFAQFVPTGNYNFVTPYSYELPHGITLTVAGITFLSLWIRRERAIWLALAGSVLGLVALTKAEVFLAAAVALGGGLAAALLARPGRLRPALIFLVAAVVPPMLAFVLLTLVLTPGEALRGMLGAWNFVGQRELTSLPYFRELAGTDNPPASVRRMLLWTGMYAVVFVPAAMLGIAFRSHRRIVFAIAPVGFGLLLGLGVWRWPDINWSHFIAPAPLLLLIVAVMLAELCIRRRETRFVLPLVLVLWAGAMLAKMPLNPHIHHYGFALAMPATLMLIVILLGWLPRLIERGDLFDDGRGEAEADKAARARCGGWPLRAAVLASVVVAVWAYLHPMKLFFDLKTIPVASGGDRFLADERGVVVNDVLRHLARHSAPDETLVMLPEGLLLNYLARRTNPTGQLNFTPPALIMYGERTMLGAFDREPPDWIGVVSVDTAEYGARSFGTDYAGELNAWIDANYEDAGLFRLSWDPDAFEIRLMRRR